MAHFGHQRDLGHWPGPNGTTEDVCQQVNYAFDANLLTGSTTYMAGRLGGVAYGGANCQGLSESYGPWVSGNNYNEAFTYTQAGQVTNKTFRLIQYSAASIRKLDGEDGKWHCAGGELSDESGYESIDDRDV